MVCDHRGYDLGEIEPSVHAFLAQTIYPEQGGTAGKEINGPGQGLCYSPLIVYHADADACDFGEMCRHKACVKFLLQPFRPCRVLSAVHVVIHVPPKMKRPPLLGGGLFRLITV